MTPLAHQLTMVKFLRGAPGVWHPFASDQQTIEIICSLHNLGIATVKGDRIILASPEKADSFTRSHAS